MYSKYFFTLHLLFYRNIFSFIKCTFCILLWNRYVFFWYQLFLLISWLLLQLICLSFSYLEICLLLTPPTPTPKEVETGGNEKQHVKKKEGGGWGRRHYLFLLLISNLLHFVQSCGLGYWFFKIGVLGVWLVCG